MKREIERGSFKTERRLLLQESLLIGRLLGVGATTFEKVMSGENLLLFLVNNKNLRTATLNFFL